MENAKKEKKPKSKARKIVEWVLVGLFSAVFAFFAVMQIVAYSTKRSNHGVPKYGNYQVLQILTDSMEPKYKVKGVVFVEDVKPETLEVGDDVTFMWNVNGQMMPMTHRLSDIKTPEETGTGHYQFTAHGINKNSSQCSGDCTDQTQVFNEASLLGKVVGYSVVIGGIFTFMTTPWGLLVLLLLPALYLIITSVIDIVRAAKDPETETEGEIKTESEGALSGMSEEDKKRLKEELLNQMIEEKTKGGNENG